MNNGRMWCVVNPTIGIPLFLGGVVVASLSVHTAILTNTTWFADFLAGRKMGATAQIDTKGISPVVLRTEDGKAAFAINVTPAVGDNSSFVIKVDRLPGDLALASSKTTVK
jgi:light-harvesting protein B-800-850 alpha chain